MGELESESMKEFIKNLTQAKEEECIIKDNILNNPEYMDQLVQKLRDNSYVLENHDKGDSLTTHNNLSFLFKIVDDYAKDNNMYPVCENCYDIYYLEYHNYMFSIYKKRKDKNIEYGCYPSYLLEKYLPYYIKFEDIKNNNVMDINKGLILELKELIDKLHENGFPLYFIQQLADNMIEVLRKDEKHNIYQKRY